MSSGIFTAERGLGIIYCVIAHGTSPLVCHAIRHGNFTEVCQQVLKAIVSESNNRLSYAVDE